MSDTKGIDRVDQGTIFMFSLVFLLAGATTLWFACNWYQKRTKKRQEGKAKATASKKRLKQTFSRFSQVDEELTMHHIDDEDEAILQAHTNSVHSLNDVTGSAETPASQEGTSRTEMTSLSSVNGGHHSTGNDKPYLETDL